MEKRYQYITPSDYDLAEKNGIKRATLEARVREYGWEMERATTESPQKHKPFQPIWEKWEAIASENGVSRELFYDRVRRFRISEKEAATVPPRLGGRPKSRWTDEDLALIKKNGLNLNMVNTRVNTLGWSKEDALNTPKLTEAERIERLREGVKKRRVHREFNKKNRAMGN